MNRPFALITGKTVLDLNLVLMQLVNGLQLGLLLFMVAAGLTLVFGILDFVNLAHASVYMVGAMICASLSFIVGGFLPALVLAVPLTALVGLLIERLVARRLYSRGHLDHVLATFGLILVLNTSAHLIWGPN
ncbi:MAG: branched-chain amino acid ABC transporter permease, partial [Burkholderiaceae bacterium]